MSSLSGRLVLILVLGHAILLPVLFYALSTVVERVMLHEFVSDARIQGRAFADSLEGLDAVGQSPDVVAQLDSAILGGRIVYATWQRDDILLGSSLMTESDIGRFREDFEFGQHGDDTYFLALPVVSGSTMAMLRLGFDESETFEHFEDVRRSILMVTVAYALVTLIAATYLSSVVIKPLKGLQHASRTIASGQYEKQLKPDSNLAEIDDLAQDLEHMRSKLVGVNARLQTEIAERELAEAERRSLESRLQHAQRLESLGTLAGGVAHEFNNVLQPLLLYTDLALEDLPEDSPVVPNLVRVLNLATRAKGLSQQILMFGRQEIESPMEALHIMPVIEEAIMMIRALLPASVDIRTDIQCENDIVECDAGQIQQLVVNLCTNAYQALQGGGHIKLSLDCENVSAARALRYPNLQEGPYVVLEIADTGRGMDADTAQRAFEPFFTTQEVGKGTGLGLSVVHGIVMRHRGEIALDSEPGKGTRFRIYLPMASGSIEEKQETGQKHG